MFTIHRSGAALALFVALAPSAPSSAGARTVRHDLPPIARRNPEHAIRNHRMFVRPWAGQRRPSRAPDIFFVPTEERVAEAMLKLAHVAPADIVYDLGSGDGRIVMLAAQKFGARGVGIELDPTLVEISRQAAREAEVTDRVAFIEGDLFTADISGASVVTLYLSPSVNARLEEKLKRELRPGTRIVSHQFGIGHWSPDATVRADDGTDIYLWTVPRPRSLIRPVSPEAAAVVDCVHDQVNIGH